MRYALLALLPLLGVPAVANAQLSIGISIGAYPHFDTVPGYPVYYATDIASNYFFFDGLYWVYQDDNWYSSSWYDGPWDAVDPIFVPEYLLQVPVRYFRRPPVYFRGWQSDRAPRWGEHWGRDWDQRRTGWDRPRAHLAPAPLPDYQRQYSGASYPKGDQQRALRDQNYRYRPASGDDRPGANARPAPGKPAQDGRIQARPAQDIPAQRDTRQDRPTGNLPNDGAARRSEAQNSTPAAQSQRPAPQAPAQQPQRRPQEPQPALQRQTQRPEAQRPEARRTDQPAQQRPAPQREQRQPAPRPNDAGRQDGPGNGRGNGNRNGNSNSKQDDNRHPDR
jgi:hypothetical protein